MRFVLDVHLGGLARLLRMLGFDALWWPRAEDPDLLERARAERRILLTRDRALCGIAPPELRHYVSATDPEEQLAEVLDALSLRAAAAESERHLSRCLDCNAPIEPLPREEARGRVPEGVFERQREFFWCPGCGRIYWEGSHYDRMKARIEALLGGGARA